MKNLASILRVLPFALLCGCGGGEEGGVGGGGGGGSSNPPPPSVQVYTVLHTFKGEAEGTNPDGLIWDRAGNIYGTTVEGGDLPDNANGCGTIFKLDPNGTLTTLHAFAGSLADGANPQTRLIRDTDGNLYGATFRGGVHQAGIVFKLDATGNETVLYHFSGGTDGFSPELGVRDADGNLYGTTGFNGALVKCTHDCGTVFKLDTTGHLTTLHTFNGLDGDEPSGPLIEDAAGNFYGTTAYGGTVACIHPLGCGTVFKLDASGTFTTLHSFLGAEAEGEVPSGGLTQDEVGNLYGTTIGGGRGIGGTVFKVDPTGLTSTLQAFTAADGGEEGHDPGGQNPRGGVLHIAGNLYGTTSRGGPSGWGVAFKLNIASRIETVLHTFAQAGGGGPRSPVIADDDGGNLYGTGFVGGDTTCHPPTGCGIVFKIRLPN